MAKALTKAQTIGKLADKSGWTKKEVTGLLENLSDLAYKEAKNGFTLPGLGKLVLVSRKARMGRNPRTGEPIRIKASNVPGFKAGKALKEAVN